MPFKILLKSRLTPFISRTKVRRFLAQDIKMEDNYKDSAEETKEPLPQVPALERKIWGIIAKHQERHHGTSEKQLRDDLANYYRSKGLPFPSGEEYLQALYNLTHNLTEGLRCSEVAWTERNKEVREYFVREE